MALLVVLATVVLAEGSKADRNDLKPSDFEPLIELPWRKPDATLENVLGTIFREPNRHIRYAVLAEYLREMPVEQLGRAFELCIRHEGTQTPNELVSFFLLIWAERDPLVCWKRTKDLFRLVGIEEGWLSYDRWDYSPITVKDVKAIQASGFWLESESLKGFPLGVAESTLLEDKRLQLFKEFSDLWFQEFKTWPGYARQDDHGYLADSPRMMEIFARQAGESLIAGIDGETDDDAAAFEIAMRRWLAADPGSALDVIKTVQEPRWRDLAIQWNRPSGAPSAELLMVWAKADLPGIVKWAESLDLGKSPFAVKAKGLLMPRVEAVTRTRWLAEAKSDKPEDDMTPELLSSWASWDPKPALDAAVATKNAETIDSVAYDAAYGLGSPGLWNTCHHGLGVIKGFDVASLPEDLRREVIPEWGITIMEQWGAVDIGEAARYGLDFILRNDYAPRENLIALFSGDDKFSSDSDMIDRTFCALRVWAIVQPREMEKWIETLKDPELRKALTWLRQNPFGGEKKR